MKHEDAAEAQGLSGRTKTTRRKKCDEVHSHAFLMTSEQRFLFALLESSASPHEMLALDETCGASHWNQLMARSTVGETALGGVARHHESPRKIALCVICRFTHEQPDRNKIKK